jgi:selenide,water dikinase
MKELMTGAVEELARMGATIVGGHSIEGPRLLAGFTVTGNQVVDVRTKGQLKNGDLLVLSKPLGTGALLAAWMQCVLEGKYFQPMVDSMLLSNQIALQLAQRTEVSAVTDVTGFGLAGHLAEMLIASGKSATLNLADIPLLPGSKELLENGVESTLAPDNRLIMEKVNFNGFDVSHRDVASLFDPQTGGGLLFGIDAGKAAETIKFMGDNGFENATIVGSVEESDGETVSLNIR